MTDIYPYINLAPDPLHEVAVCWIDNREGADGSEQTLDYDDGSVDVTGESVPESDYYVYRAVVDGLSADTRYSGTVDGSETVEWTTLPQSLGEITILVGSDFHITEENNTPTTSDNPSAMDPMADHEPDIFLFAGDLVDLADQWDEFRADAYLDWFADYWEFFRDADTHPHFAWVPGNHDVGNHYWTGDPDTESVEPEWWIQYFMEYPQESEPVGENYGSWELGDYLQILGIDTHSAFPVDVGDWVEETLDESKTWCLPFMHSPMLQCGDRSSFRDDEDLDLQRRLREHVGRHLLKADNVHCYYSGHIHTRSRTLAWTMADSPEDKAIGPVSEGDGLIQFGEGYAGGRSLIDEWYIDYNEQEEQYYTFTITDRTMTVREYDEDGTEYEESPVAFNADDGADWTLNGSIVADVGDASIGDVKFGGA